MPDTVLCNVRIQANLISEPSRLTLAVVGRPSCGAPELRKRIGSIVARSILNQSRAKHGHQWSGSTPRFQRLIFEVTS